MVEPKQYDRRPDALGDFHLLSDDTVCRILSLLSPPDIGKLACVSSVFYILCSEEPLWMQLCLEKHEGPLDYKCTWRQTALAKLGITKDLTLYSRPPRQFQGFSSAFLYRRWYRCHVALEGFALDTGAVERRSGLQPQEFADSYDCKKPVLLTDLLHDWQATKSWKLDQLVEKCGDAKFKVSQPHGKSVAMTLKEFAGYMEVQHDEEPLYIFDPQFGESVPELLNDYTVPALFSEDLFSVLSESQRPPFRWLVLGPARSGASWHVDPSLTSAWNSLLSGRKRWALYPPGKVPPGVTLDVDDDDGSIHYDGPNSLQWWLDVYPHLDEDDKPLECTQLPGETIYVPCGWWHCVLNIDASTAVTQNFVNANNLEIVCMDLAPGYWHRAIARAGIVALEGRTLNQVGETAAREADPIFKDAQTSAQLGRDRALMDRNSEVSVELEDLMLEKGARSVGGVTDQNLLLALDALKISSKENQASEGKKNKSDNIGESVMREWLRRLWIERPDLQQTIWKGACLSLDAGRWLHRINVICNLLGLSIPAGEDQLPVGDGTNPVYFAGDYVVKLYIQEAGPAASIDVLGSELNFYAALKESGSPFQAVVPEFVASGILYPVGEDYTPVPWDGTGDCYLVYEKDIPVGKKRHRDLTKKGGFRTKWSADLGVPGRDQRDVLAQEAKLWPYLVTKRCPGKTVSQLRENMTERDFRSLATFLGNEVRFLHTLPIPVLEQAGWDDDQSEKSCSMDKSCEQHQRGRDFKEAKCDSKSPFTKESVPQRKSVTCAALITPVTATQSKTDAAVDTLWKVPKVWRLFVSYLRKQHKDVHQRLREWGSLPDHLLKQVDAYLPKDPVVLIGDIEGNEGVVYMSALPVWLHMDMMADNIQMQVSDEGSVESVESLDCTSDRRVTQLPTCHQNPVVQARHILDYGDLLHGDPLYELLALHLDVFNLKDSLLEDFLRNYQLPLSSQLGVRHVRGTEGTGSECQHKLSYCAMCYCLLHEMDAMAAIFKLRPDVRTATSFEEIEEKIWGALNVIAPNKYNICG